MGELYEGILERIFIDVSRVYGAHEPHLMPTPGRPAPCSNCGHVEGGQPERCGGDFAETRCDPLGDAFAVIIEAAFPPTRDAITSLLADTPQAWMWGDSSFGYDSLLESAAAAFRLDAYWRLGLDGRGTCEPRDPRATWDDARAGDRCDDSSPDGLHYVGCPCP